MTFLIFIDIGYFHMIAMVKIWVSCPWGLCGPGLGGIGFLPSTEARAVRDLQSVKDFVGWKHSWNTRFLYVILMDFAGFHWSLWKLTESRIYRTDSHLSFCYLIISTKCPDFRGSDLHINNILSLLSGATGHAYLKLGLITGWRAYFRALTS